MTQSQVLPVAPAAPLDDYHKALRKAHENSFAAEEATTVTLAHEVTKEQRARREEAERRLQDAEGAERTRRAASQWLRDEVVRAELEREDAQRALDAARVSP